MFYHVIQDRKLFKLLSAFHTDPSWSGYYRRELLKEWTQDKKVKLVGRVGRGHDVEFGVLRSKWRCLWCPLRQQGIVWEHRMWGNRERKCIGKKHGRILEINFLLVFISPWASLSFLWYYTDFTDFNFFPMAFSWEGEGVVKGLRRKTRVNSAGRGGI